MNCLKDDILKNKEGFIVFSIYYIFKGTNKVNQFKKSTKLV